MTREEAKEYLYGIVDMFGTIGMEDLTGKDEEKARIAIDTLADVPETNVGKWIHSGGDEYFCNRCTHVVHTDGSWEHPLDVGKKFCEECGAKMEREK